MDLEKKLKELESTKERLVALYNQTIGQIVLLKELIEENKKKGDEKKE